jgi:hypothetical protein
MNPYAIQAADIGALQAEMGADCPTVNVLGADFQVIPGSAMFNQPLRDGGFSQMYDLGFTLLVAQFSALNLSPPGVRDALLNEQMTYLGTAYRINNVHILAGATILAIEAVSLNQSA